METENNNYYIVYLTVNIVNKHFYIGVHKTPTPYEFDGYLGCGIYVTRPSTYKPSKYNLQKAVNKYGLKKFKRLTLYVFETEEEAFEKEAEIVNKEFLKRPDVYNMALGGDGGDRGVQSKTVYMFSLDGKLLKEFNSQADAASYIKRGVTSVKRAVLTGIKCAGYYWSDNKNFNINNFKSNVRDLKIYMYNSKGNFLTEFKTLKEASVKNNIPQSQIKECIYYRVADSKGFYYSKYKTKTFSQSSDEAFKNEKVYQYDENGVFVKEFNNYIEAAKFNKLSIKEIMKALRMKESVNHLQFSFIKFDKMGKLNISYTKQYIKGREIEVYDLKGNLIEEFKTVASCKKKYGSVVDRVLRGEYKQSKGFVFKYK